MTEQLTNPIDVAREIESRNEHLLFRDMKDPEQRMIAYRAGAAIPVTASFIDNVLHHLSQTDDGRPRKYTYTVRLVTSVEVTLDEETDDYRVISDAVDDFSLDWEVDDFELEEVELAQ